ncbi:MAG: hypothetical protein QMD53_06645 [Actinomycetota bacterium]|nr:hypothetical protein [Actinomycetota bacterium]
MDAIWLWILGAIGALVTIYARSEDPVPPFRALYDYSEDETELSRVREEIKNANLKRKELSDKYESKELDDNQFDRLTKELDDRISDLEGSRKSLDTKIRKAQIVHRVLGFIVYIVLGAVFAGLLSDLISVEGLEGQISNIAKPILIGATWTSYLSVLGFRNEEKKKQEAEEKAEAERDTAKEEITKLADTAKRAISELQVRSKTDQWSGNEFDKYFDDFFSSAENAKSKFSQDPFG